MKFKNDSTNVTKKKKHIAIVFAEKRYNESVRQISDKSSVAVEGCYENLRAYLGVMPTLKYSWVWSVTRPGIRNVVVLYLGRACDMPIGFHS